MATKSRSATAESAVKREVRTPKYRMRVVQSAVKYDRKRQKRSLQDGMHQANGHSARSLPSFV